MKTNNKKVSPAILAEKTFHTAGFDIAVTFSYDEEPVFMVGSVDVFLGAGKHSKTENREVNNLFGTLGAWFNGDIDVLPVKNLDLEKLSSFERKILCELRMRFSRGKTVSYGELARLAGFPGAARAVGTVMSKNPFPLFFPCHRVIRSDGSTGFFQGGPAGVRLKKALLEAEKVNEVFQNCRR
jgi:O-6-methylguanine DNA methyltransferase